MKKKKCCDENTENSFLFDHSGLETGYLQLNYYYHTHTFITAASNLLTNNQLTKITHNGVTTCLLWVIATAAMIVLHLTTHTPRILPEKIERMGEKERDGMFLLYWMDASNQMHDSRAIDSPTKTTFYRI